MIKRKELNKLVVVMISNRQSPPTAKELYISARQERGIFQQEKVRGFKSFIKIINTFPQIQPLGQSPRVYTIKK